MRRRLFTVFLLLLASAVVNVAVAWGCDRWATMLIGSAQRADEWPLGAPDGWPSPTQDLYGQGFGVVEWACVVEEFETVKDPDLPALDYRGHLSISKAFVQRLRRVGWPVHCVASREQRVWSFERTDGHAIEIDIASEAGGWLPIQLQWHRLMANTGFYAVLLWSLSRGIVRFSRDSRFRARSASGAALLLLGGLITIGVAWACVMTTDLSFSEIVTRTNPEDPVYREQIGFQRAFGRLRVNHKEGLQVGAKSGRTEGLRQSSREIAGWPWLSVMCWTPSQVMFLHPSGGNVSNSGDLRLYGGIELPPEPSSFVGQPMWRALPVVPVWPAFLYNALLFASLSWLPLAGPFALRRLIRRCRGQCLSCGYPMGNAAVCSECGNPVPGRVIVA